MRHIHRLTVRFGDCDPAGIAYFPRIYDWFHQAMETWFAEHLGTPYDVAIREWKLGFPAVKSEAEFKVPCALGDSLRIELTVPRLGTRSLDLAYRIHGEDGVLRATGQTTVVIVDLDPQSATHLRSIDPPPALAKALAHFTDPSNE
ncbi:MAG: acyl-CoA thioesterase [Proteobacteria bacterium]|nr:acyl-CoA thioesterase [Pseudomonadota bacterium]